MKCAKKYGRKLDEEIKRKDYFYTIMLFFSYFRLCDNGLKEACANWGKIIICGSANSCSGAINDFINSNQPMNSDAGSLEYGAVMFPLTIHRRYGGSFFRTAVCAPRRKPFTQSPSSFPFSSLQSSRAEHRARRRVRRRRR